MRHTFRPATCTGLYSCRYRSDQRSEKRKYSNIANMRPLQHLELMWSLTVVSFAVMHQGSDLISTTEAAKSFYIECLTLTKNSKQNTFRGKLASPNELGGWMQRIWDANEVMRAKKRWIDQSQPLKQFPVITDFPFTRRVQNASFGFAGTIVQRCPEKQELIDQSHVRVSQIKAKKQTMQQTNR